ncbi:NAD-dependent epimerase/dehydratase family protein [Vibrio cyclitrophicus]|uniref:NAD-dependent epimerase/dehydratase family protein n=1 Tax=Vibrio cyclitrophicus TaxID=47951 RepID=UPI000C82E171|nr:SDR family oxidoreductase [Vibrio cyclitrophicus]PMH74644.1 dTDP-glucose 4,6-dehydratase [Vibrio cyclitrophicus]
MYTIIGGQGFIGSTLVSYLKDKGANVYVPKKNDNSIYQNKLGTVIYCAGNGDCINTPHKVLEANVLLLSKILQDSDFDKLIYLSSTRVYMGSDAAHESSSLTVFNNDDRRLFNITKLVAEELCLKSNRKTIIIRPSNVYGVALNSPLFLPSITRDAIKHGKITMYISPDYSKDYVSVDDVVRTIHDLANKKHLSKKIYNVASGENTSAYKIAQTLVEATGCQVEWVNTVTDEMFPTTDISSLKSDIDYNPRNVINDISEMVKEFKQALADE